MKNSKWLDLSWYILGPLLFSVIAIVSYNNSSVHPPSIYAQGIDCYVSQIFLPNVVSNHVTPTATPVQQLWEEEPNDIPDEATGPIRAGINYYGYPNDRSDYFYFDMATTGQISITLENLTGSGDRQLILYYQSQDNLVANDSNEPFQIVRSNRQPGRYLVRIYVESGHNTTMPYTLRVDYPVALAETASLDSISDSLPECTPTTTPVLPTDTPTATQTPTSTDTVTPSPTSTTAPEMGWCDDFNNGLIDQSKWLPPTDANIIYEQDGVLNLLVTAEQSQASGAWAELGAIPAGQISEVSFTTSIQSFTGTTPGAGGLGVNLEDARIFSVDVGPAQDGPGIEYSLCHTLPCTEYEQSYHPDGASFPVGSPTPIKMVWTGETVKFFVNGVARVDAPTNHKPIKGFHLYAYADKGSIFHVTIDDVCVKYYDTAAPTATPTASPKPTTQYGYNFEESPQNWTTSEGEYKYAILEMTKQFVYSGIQALRLATELRVESDPVFRYTEAVAYFDRTTPEGMSSANSYNLTGKSVSCYVYLPSDLAPSGNTQAYMRLFVKDSQYRNQYSNTFDILPSNISQWHQLNLTVGQGGSIDPGFDSKQVYALGVRIELYNQATLDYVGSLYIDHCAIQQP